MQEPVTSSMLLTVICAIGVASGQDAYPVVISSFAGAVVFVMSAADIPVLKRWVFFFLSFFLGITLSNSIAKFISAIIPFVDSFQADQAVGALVASAVSIRIAISFSNKKGLGSSIVSAISSFFNKLGGDK